ncbi:MAG: autotransporter outer membrane beta-barrel domain-containing protein [Proteobacteria bacterium]|nr:autotransporter outer membrane beta-barrel domain-containing protein [Pseudomonadota bacterium]
MATMLGWRSATRFVCALSVSIDAIFLWNQRALADCSSAAPTSGETITCTTTPPAQNTTGVNAAAGSSNVTVNVDPGAGISVPRTTTPTAISVIGNSQVTNNGAIDLSGGGGTGTNRGAGIVGMTDGNILTNNGTIGTTGAFNDGLAANGSNNTLTNNGTIITTGPNAYGMSAAWGQTNIGQSGNTLTNTGSVTTNGSNARAASILGGNGSVNNSGTLTTISASSTAVYMQGNNDTLVNSGTIHASGAGSEGVFSNTLSPTFSATIQNLSGGQIISDNGPALRTLNGNTTITNAGLIQSGAGVALNGGNSNTSAITLILQTGSQIVGSMNGGGGNNQVVLQGSGLADNPFTRFQTLTMNGTDWTWNGTGDFVQTFVNTGILRLQSPLTGNATIAPGATLEASAQTLNPTVTDNGLLLFSQPNAGTYGGTISGTGVVEKTGAGTLTLAPTSGNSYSGGTVITQGALAIGADNAIGAPTGALTFNGGTLQLAQSFNLAATRAITLAAAGGTIDTQSFSTTIAQAITGPGALTKLGAGMLTLNADNPYAGPTNVLAGTLVVGDSSHLSASLSGGGPVLVAGGATLGGFGSVAGDVSNSGTIAVGNALPAFAGAPMSNFTIGGNYTGNSGTLLLNTVLNAGGPLGNQFTDRLLINGSASGGTTVQVKPSAGGAFTSTGAPTNSTGISLIQVAGASSPGAFTLPGGYIVGGSPFQYHLNAYGPGSSFGRADPGQNIVGNPGGFWDFRLQNVYLDPSGEEVTPGKSPAAGARLAVAPQIPSYITTPSVLFNTGLQDIDELHRRLGEIRDAQAAGLPRWGEVFARGYGNTMNYTSTRSFSDYGFASSQSYAAFQMGGSGVVRDDDAGSLRVGLAGSYGKVQFDPSAPDGFSEGNFNVGKLSGIATWQAQAGWYLDSIVSGGWFSGTVSTTARGQAAALSGSIVSASLEGGWPIALGWRKLAVEPQVQVSWQHLMFDGTTDANGLQVGLGALDQGVVRAGGRLVRPFETDDGRFVTPYLKANLLQGFADDGRINVSGFQFATGQYGTAIQVGGGLTGMLTSNLAVYGDVAWQHEVSNGGFRGWASTAASATNSEAVPWTRPATTVAPRRLPALSFPR